MRRRLPLYCSFCGKSEDDVEAIVCGPTVFICNECVEAAADVVEDIKKQRIAAAVKASIVGETG